MIKLSVCPQFREDWTSILVAGENEEDVANLLISRLQMLDYEVEIADEEGEMVPFEDFDHG
jgi:hypothetical protein